MKAKRRDLFSAAQRQLPYLSHSTARVACKSREEKCDYATLLYERIPILLHGHHCSRERRIIMPNDVMNPEGWKIIFNFVVTILEYAVKCSPTVTPTKAAARRGDQ